MIHLGDCLEGMKKLADNSVDAIVTDPPYGLSKEPDMAEVLRHWLNGDDYAHPHKGFMGKAWDSFVPGPTVWREALRVLKPGGHLLSFFGTRTYDMGVLALRLAGFEIRDSMAWLYGSGFPKSHDVSKAIDKAAGAERTEVIGTRGLARWKDGAPAGAAMKDDGGIRQNFDKVNTLHAPATPDAERWQGWGTALKPAFEPIVLARKPLQGTVAANVLAHGTGGLNIDGCRVGSEERSYAPKGTSTNAAMIRVPEHRAGKAGAEVTVSGRWPANLIHDGSDEVLAGFPLVKGGTAVRRNSGGNTFGGSRPKPTMGDMGYGGTGSAARFFYCAKASKADREEGLERFDDAILARSCQAQAEAARGNTIDEGDGAYNKARIRKNNHPTVKPTDLMRYLCRLVTPPGGLILDPYTGSGSTAKAAALEGFRFIGFELDERFHRIAMARWLAATNEEDLA